MLPFWLKFLPANIRNRIEYRSNLLNALSNSGWLFADKVVRMGVGLLVGIWVARYLGPEQYGLFNYTMSIVILFGAVAGLGLNGIVVRDLVRDSDGANVTLGTAFLLQLIAGLFAFVISIGTIKVLRTDDDVATVMVAIFGFMLVFKATDAVRYWFESQVKSKYIVWVENSAYLLTAAVRILLILVKAPLIAFVWATLVEAALVGALLLLVYSKNVGKLSLWSVSYSRAKRLLVECWPLILVSVASIINMRMDQVMLGSMVNDAVVGNYSAAVRIAEVWLIIPSVIGSSIYPTIISSKEKDEEMYRRRILKTIKLMAIIVIPIAVCISFFSEAIIHLIYGGLYGSAGYYLAIYIWTGVPYLVFFILNQVFQIEGLLKYGFWVSIFAVITNIVLNLLLIPRYGGAGAAISTLVTSMGSTLLSLLLLNAKTKIFWGN